MGAYLVTGGGGFLGRHIALRLAEQGHEVFCPYRRRMPPQHTHIQAFPGDITLQHTWGKYLPTRLDGAILFAALLPGALSFTPYMIHNVTGTAAVLDVCAERGAPPVIFASSLYLAAPACTAPIADDAPLAATHPYYISKYAGECLCRAYAAGHGTRHVCFRIASPYGPGMSEQSIIMRFIRQSLEKKTLTVHDSGLYVQNFISVNAITEAVLLALKQGNGLYNLGGESKTIKDLAKIICRISDNGTTIQHVTYSGKNESLLRWIPSTTKVRKEIGLSSEIDIETGCRKLYNIVCQEYGGHHAE